MIIMRLSACCTAVLQVDPQAWLMGVDCNVSSPASVHRLADAAVSALGSVDVWINNAGYSGSYQVGPHPCSATSSSAGPALADHIHGSW